jgi:hypothetical protein
VARPRKALTEQRGLITVRLSPFARRAIERLRHDQGLTLTQTIEGLIGLAFGHGTELDSLEAHARYLRALGAEVEQLERKP